MDMVELTKRTDRMQRQIEGLESRVVEVEKSHSIADVIVQNIDRRLGGIEDGQKWIVRLIVGSILLALLTIAMGGGPVQ